MRLTSICLLRPRIVDQAFGAALSKLVSDDEALDLRLLRLIDLQIPDGSVADEWAVWLEFWNEARRRPELRARSDEVYRGWVDAIATIVRDGMEQGFFRGNTGVDDFALRFAGMFDGLGMQVLLQPTLARRWQLRQVLVGVVERELDVPTPG